MMKRSEETASNIRMAAQLLSYLQLSRVPVGVKLAYSAEEYQRYEAKEVSRPIRYCVAVKCAGLGHSIKLTASNSGCSGSTMALGFQSPQETFYSGEEGCDMGLFERLSEVLHGLEFTINGTESNERKQGILQKVSVQDWKIREITMNSAYYLK